MKGKTASELCASNLLHLLHKFFERRAFVVVVVVVVSNRGRYLFPLEGDLGVNVIMLFFLPEF
jgi:hypothetical protein